MTLDEAIRILTNLNQEEEIVGWLDIKPAVQLGIEALKREQTHRKYLFWKLPDFLPGETS